MRPAWGGILGWLCMLAAALLGLFVVPHPVDGWVLLAIALAVAGGALVALQVRRPASRVRRR